MASLRERNTPDVIVMLLSITVCFVIVISTFLVVGVLIWGSPSQAGEIVGRVAELTNSLIAVIVGFIGGRGAAALNGKNGNTGSHNHPEEG